MTSTRTRVASACVVLALAACGGPPPPAAPAIPALPDASSTDATAARRTLDNLLTDGDAPGVQYVVVSADRPVFEYARGWADIARRRPVEAGTTFMAYSMSKTFTAVAVLQLAEQGKLRLDDPIARYLAPFPYDSTITIRQVIAHTAGIPNPLPLRWVHPADAHAQHDDGAALDAILREHGTQAAAPGERYGYSNIGYWLLGRLIERVSGEPFDQYMQAHVLAPLGVNATELGYRVPDVDRHARGYLERRSFMNLIKGFFIDDALIGDADGGWVNIRDHYVNGAAFGGLVGTARAFSYFVRDQLRPRSAILGPVGCAQLREQQRRADGDLVPMTLGWHVERVDGRTVLFKEGGGGGFHVMMRVYPDAGIGSVLLSNATSLDVRRVMNEVDRGFLVGR